MEIKKKKVFKVVELSDDRRLLKVNGFVVVSVDFRKDKLSVSRAWCEHVGLKLCVGERFKDCEVV